MNVVCSFTELLAGKGNTINFENLPEEDLAVVLREFFPSIRTKDGNSFSRSGYRNLRNGIQCHLQSQPFCKTVEIRKDKTFLQADNIYDAKLKELKQSRRDP